MPPHLWFTDKFPVPNCSCVHKITPYTCSTINGSRAGLVQNFYGLQARTMTMVREESMVVDTSVMAKSLDTRGMSDTAKMPFSSLAAALRNACQAPQPKRNQNLLHQVHRDRVPGRNECRAHWCRFIEITVASKAHTKILLLHSYNTVGAHQAFSLVWKVSGCERVPSKSYAIYNC